MQRYIGLLRAINVGGHVVKMDALRKHFEALGFKNVATFIASGNVIFDAAGVASALESKIESALRNAFGYDVATFLRTPAELTATAAYPAFSSNQLDSSSLYVMFMKQTLSRTAQKELAGFRGPTDDFHVNGREVYWLVHGKLMESAFSAARFEKSIAAPVTVRNITTVRRLASKYAEK